MFSSNVHWVFSKDIRIQDKKIEKQWNLSDLTSSTRCRAIPFSFQLLNYDLLPQPCTSMLSCFRLLASASISAPWLGGGLAHKSSPLRCWLSFTPWMSKKITKRHRNAHFFSYDCSLWRFPFVSPEIEELVKRLRQKWVKGITSTST